MTLRVAVDFGTSNTCVVATFADRSPQVILIDGQPLMPSAICWLADGTIFIGRDAEKQLAVAPDSCELQPKRRIDDEKLLLDNTVHSLTEVIRAILARAVDEARRVANGAVVDVLVLTYPADWGRIRQKTLRQAAHDLANQVVLVAEPVAAASFYAKEFSESNKNPLPLAVLDFGGGTVDISVIGRAEADENSPLSVLATRGDATWGGIDIDQALVTFIGNTVSTKDPEIWRALTKGRQLADWRRRQVLLQDVRAAKETLSRHAFTDVPLPPPFLDAHLTRGDLELLITEPLRRTLTLLDTALNDAALRANHLSAIFLVGGASRIPLIARLIQEHTGLLPTALDQPETVVAQGALTALSASLTSPPIPPSTSGFTFSPLNAKSPGPADSDLPWARSVTAKAAGVGDVKESGSRRRITRWALGITLAGLVFAGLIVVPLRFGEHDGTVDSRSSISAAGQSEHVIAQYDYSFALPHNWLHVGGGLPADRKAVLKPADMRWGNDLVVVQEFTNDYDATANRQQLIADLQYSVEQGGSRYSHFSPEMSFGNRPVIHYRETRDGVAVNWYVLAQGSVRIHIGCQYAGFVPREHVDSACELTARTLEIRV